MKLRFLLTALLVVLVLPVVAATSELNEVRINKIERYVYGDEQVGAVSARLNQLEEDLFGRSTRKDDVEKIAYLHDFIFKDLGENPSLDMKLSFLEWKLFNKTLEGSLETRLAELEKHVTGLVSVEPLAFRVEQLVHLTIENGLISLHRVRIPRGTEIKLKLDKTISSKTARKNDIVPMSVVNDLFVSNNILTMSKGGIISARVRSVRRGGRFGRSGFVNLDIRSIESMDSTELPVKVVYAGQERFDKKRIGMAAGASTLGYVLLGPLGVASGGFIKGDDIEIPAGTEIVVKTTQDMDVVGVLVHRK